VGNLASALFGDVASAQLTVNYEAGGRSRLSVVTAAVLLIAVRALMAGARSSLAGKQLLLCNVLPQQAELLTTADTAAASEGADISLVGMHSGFDVSADAEGVTLKLSRPGEDHRTAEIHLHYYLCADVLAELAKAIAARPAIDESHRDPMLKSVNKLAWALSGAPEHVRAIYKRSRCDGPVNSRAQLGLSFACEGRTSQLLSCN
jgi:hypothetical protein